MDQIPDAALPMSQRAYAKRRGVSAMAVSRAISDGRLKQSVNADKKIIDPELADKEWAENTDYTDAPYAVAQKAEAYRQKTDGEIDERRESDPSIIEANRREKWAKAKLAELKLEREAGTLVKVDEITAGYAAQVVGIRNKLLGIPSRAKQQIPDLSLQSLGVLDALIREALEDVASEPDDVG